MGQGDALKRLAMLLALAACAPDETASAFAEDATYLLETIDGASLPRPATLVFDGPGRIGGQGPCNAWGARLTVPYPWFAIDGIEGDAMACPGAGEERYFDALRAMEFAEIQGPVLILSNAAGRQMVFRAAVTR